MVLYLVLLLSFISAIHMNDDYKPVEEELIVAKHVQLLGSWHKANPMAKDVQEAAKKAVEKYNMKPRVKAFFKLLTVTSANTQITNMINFRINATIGKTTCLKTETEDPESCTLAPKRFQCKFDVTFNARNDQYEVKAVTCNKIVKARHATFIDKNLHAAEELPLEGQGKAKLSK